MTAISEAFKKQTRSPLTIWLAGLSVLILLGLYGAAQVLINGLGVTGLSDAVPWGLWITIDLSAIGLGAGAFSFSAVVYLFKIKRFEPIARPAVFVGFLGYTSAMIALAMDIGRPDRFWHPLVHWNVHSVLWEITWCVILYSTVLAIEFLPIVFEWKFFDRWPRLRKFSHTLHKATPVLAVMGLALSLLHQSSLGATYGVLSGRAIWFKPSLPVMFIVSAVGGGMSLTLLATMAVEKLRGKQILDKFLKRDIARLASIFLMAYLYLKLWDWAATSYYSHAPSSADMLNRLNATTPYSPTFWWLEIVLGGLIPVAFMLYRRTRRNDLTLMFAAAMAVLGLIVNRWNTTLSGLVAPPAWSPGMLGNVTAVSYFPTFIEVAVGLGIVGYALIFFTLGAKYLPIFGEYGGHAEES
jgi:menaquinone reductase, integral membrane subunit